MKCLSCQANIDPKWHHAIEINVCPYCGNPVMEQLLKELLSTLQDTMEKLQSYPDQLGDWLLSNYDYIKTDNPNLKNYVPQEILKNMKKELDDNDFDRNKKTIKVKTDRGEEDVLVEKIQSDSKTASFFERAEIIKRDASNEDGDDRNEDVDSGESGSIQLGSSKPQKPKTFKTAAERTKYLKKLKEKIEHESSQGIIGEEGLAAMIDPSNETMDPEDMAALQSVVGSGDIINSALPAPLDDEDRMADRVLSMNLSASNRNSVKGHDGGYNQKDAQALQNLVDKAQGKNMGGGFSRS
jgi:Zn-finger nucleic acid-binding protein